MLKLSPLFGDGAVLCRGKEIRIFGEAREGALVCAALCSRAGELMAEGYATARDGRFVVRLAAQEAQTGCTLIVSSEGEPEYRAGDIAIGEVFLAGGQSNMELELQNADEGADCIARHNDPLLRFFNVPKQPVWNDEARAALDAARWVSASPGQCRDVSAVAYFFALRVRERFDVPVGIIDCYWGGTSATCWTDAETLRATAAGQQVIDEYAALVGDKTDEEYDRELEGYDMDVREWNARVEALRAREPDIPWVRINQEAGAYPWPPPRGSKSPYRPAGLVETMLKPVTPCALTGVLYYQGEEDVCRAELYFTLLSTLVLHWRALFEDEDLPFLNVQLPMFIGNGETDDGRWALLREAQRRVWRSIARTGLAVLLDQGEFDNVHPTAKRVVGDRLFEQALSVVYGQEGQSSPRAIGHYVQGDTLVVLLSAPVHAMGGEPCLLELAGADGVFHPAQATLKGCEMHLQAEGVRRPVQARYAHVNFAAVTLFGGNGLPLAPFERC